MSHSPCGEYDIFAGQLGRTLTLDIDTQWYVLTPPLTEQWLGGLAGAARPVPDLVPGRENQAGRFPG